jgi:hypothetical protein
LVEAELCGPISEEAKELTAASRARLVIALFDRRSKRDRDHAALRLNLNRQFFQPYLDSTELLYDLLDSFGDTLA